ncbi:hypothetical protein SISSUDRAFT_1060709 [Sistotremastrum suecicum HHB10207 ss-3]|uniref:Uncharacterized protein n=1 Tax=Sistotremastrum suecicum HHB10207 ss-3 TaxID=1314776 RepID=A0A166ET15_9AGAM|nr:hypothetical protein SISSUDRAFT_1060709 [Sistotremastrum suecicum HHB10207 ss-3]
MIVLVAPSVDATSTIASMDSHQSCIVFTPSAIAFIVLLIMCIALVALLLLHIYYPSPPGGYHDLEGLNFRRAGPPVAQGRHKYLCQALPAVLSLTPNLFHPCSDMNLEIISSVNSLFNVRTSTFSS